MSLSLSPSAATRPAPEATGLQERATPLGAAAGGHDHAGAAQGSHAQIHPAQVHPAQVHAAQVHAAQVHPARKASPASRRPALRLGASVLRMSLAGRLGLASALILAMWSAVLLVTGGGA